MRKPDMTHRTKRAKLQGLVAFLLAMAVAGTVAGAPPPAPCVVPDNGTGTVTLPPQNCGYVSPQQVHLILDGLPPGTTIIVGATHSRFLCPNPGETGCTIPGGTLGGDVETFNSSLQLQLSGTGALAGFNRTLVLPARCETHTGPRKPGAQVQKFDTQMYRLEGEIAGDPDFQSFRVIAGGAYGLDSPGVTKLKARKNKTFEVDSFFDIHYRIEFQGTPEGRLKGLGGVTDGTVRMEATQ